MARTGDVTRAIAALEDLRTNEAEAEAVEIATPAPVTEDKGAPNAALDDWRASR